jgi:CDP-4-dehydro-6-deoxyglucose reductase
MTYRVILLETGDAFEAGRDEPLLEACQPAGRAAAARVHVRRLRHLPHPAARGRGGLRGDAACAQRRRGAGRFALACQARARSDLTISVQRGPDLPEPQRRGALVREVRRWTNDVVNLQLEIEADGLQYLPGQYMNVLLPEGGHRSFSMASRPAGNQVDFHVRQVPGGRFTEAGLGRLRAGDRLAVEIPLGSFRYHAEAYRPLLMVATGTGLAPLKSMLESLMDDEDCPPVSLYWGMRTEADLYLADDIRAGASGCTTSTSSRCCRAPVRGGAAAAATCRTRWNRTGRTWRNTRSTSAVRPP